VKRPARRSLVALLWIAGFHHSATGMPAFDAVKAGYQPSDTLVLDRRGEVVQRLRSDTTVRRGQWVALADVSPALRTALVLSEDRRFWEHSGVDWRAVSAAAWGNLWNTRTRGASTLTMQLAGLLDSDWRAGPGGRTVGQKIGQTIGAQRLEAGWRKDQILEAYLNLVPFRGELVGIDALSRTLFGKAAHGLDEREAAVSAALVRAPNAAPARVAQRACGVLQAMSPAPDAPATTAKRAASPVPAAAARAPGIDCEGLDLFVTAALQRRDYAASEGIAPHLARRLVADAGLPAPARLSTTLDAGLQRFAVQTLQRHLRELRGRHVEDGALVVLDNASGEVLAWVGSSGTCQRRGRSGRRARPAPARLHAQTLPLRAGDRRAAPDGRLAAGRRAHADPHAGWPLHSAELRPPVQGLGVGAHGAGGFAERAGGAYPGDGVARRLCPPACRPGAALCGRPATGTAPAWRWAAPKCACWT
jgi:penicillin-binding protein 1C